MLWVVSTVQHARVRRLMTDQRKRLEPASMPELGARVLGHVGGGDRVVGGALEVDVPRRDRRPAGGAQRGEEVGRRVLVEGAVHQRVVGQRRRERGGERGRGARPGPDPAVWL